MYARFLNHVVVMGKRGYIVEEVKLDMNLKV